METKRQRQVGELIRRNFGILLQQEGGYIYGFEPLVTVTAAKMSPDLGIAKIYLSVYNIEDKQNVILELEMQATRLRQLLGQRVRKHLRRVPHISFFLDDTLDEMYRLNSLFDDMNGKEQPKSVSDE